jgi:hypothetical protein
MAKSSKRRLNAGSRLRLSIELLESRTVLSATNLLASAIEIAPGFDDRFDLRNRPALIAGPADAQDGSTREAAETRFEEMPQFADRRGFFQQDSADRPEGHANRAEVGNSLLSFPGTPFESTPFAGDYSFQPIALLGGTPQGGELVQSLDDIAGGIKVRVEFDAFGGLPSFTDLLGTADYSKRLMDNTDHSELIDQRESATADGQFQQSRTSISNDRSQQFFGRSGDNGLVDVGSDNTDFSTLNRDRIFETLGGLLREGFSNAASNERTQLLLHHAAHTRDDLASLVQPPATISLGSDVSSQQLADGFIVLPSQSPSDLYERSEGQPLFAKSNAPLVSLSRQTSNRQDSSSTQIDARLNDSTTGRAAALSEMWMADSSFKSKTQSSDGMVLELELNLAGQTKAVRRTNANPLPSGDAWWHETSRHASRSFWLEFSENIELRAATDASRLLDHEVSESDASAQLVNMTTEVGGDEGGMIELIALASPDAGRSSQQHGGHSSTPRVAPEKVRMDTGIGMFQVFEIATSPQSSTHESELTANEITAPADATEVQGTDAIPPAEQAALTSDNSELEPIRAASLPALLATVLLLHRQRRPEDD